VRLLVTRPEPDGERTAQALRVRGHEVVVAALLHIEPIAFELADQSYDAVVLTSANAVRAVVRHPKRARLTALPSLTVGRHTAEAARAAGFRDVASAEGDRNDLAALLRRRFGNSGKALLHLAGEDRAGDLAACGVPVDTVVAYRAVKAKRFPPEIPGALGSLGGVLHFSRRSAETYLSCAAQADVVRAALAPVHFCLSQQAAEPLAAAGAADIRIASRPNEATLVALVAPQPV
jgi:uroporphyrinogen-III synthase